MEYYEHKLDPVGVLASIARDNSAISKFWGKVEKFGDDQCWLWKGQTQTDKYRTRGMFYHKGKSLLAHRVSACLKHGVPKKGQVTLHSCDNPLCCNPKHLKWGTQAQNVEDMVAKGRAANTKKTHCKNGHLFDQENTRIRVREGGRRACRTCQRLRMREIRAAKKADALRETLAKHNLKIVEA